MFLRRTTGDDVSDAQNLPLYEKLSRDRSIEGRVCRGEDRVEVSFKGRGSVFSDGFSVAYGILVFISAYAPTTVASRSRL